jgi:hypothetical protein
MDSRLALRCEDAPHLTARECRDVHARLLAATGGAEPRNTAEALEPDPLAEGGHVLWAASHPRREMDAWLDAIHAAGGRPDYAIPWQRAFLAAVQPGTAGNLFLTVEPGCGRLLFFLGRSLRYVRVFPLPGNVDDASPLCVAVSREAARLVQFVQQRHRGTSLESLALVGLGEGPSPELVAAAGALGLGLANLAPDLTAFLLEGAARERRRKGGMDLIPEDVREARRRRIFRTIVWTAAVALAGLCAGAKAVLLYQESTLVREAARAEAAAAERQAYARAGDEAARLRFGLLRIRWAEARQKDMLERLERLGLRLFRAPEGVQLQQVEIGQKAAEELPQRFSVEGVALTRGAFSMGSLADYFSQLSACPDVKLDPLRDVSVVDGGGTGPREKALTRFHFTGGSR